MSKIDEKYIQSLDTFTSALEEIVAQLKEQQKNNKSDAVNDFLKTPMDNLKNVVKDLQKVTTEGFKDIKSDNAKILQEIKSIKSQKESGMFDRVEDPKNKNKIVDGIKAVILIAGGVLALGLAFKIIGKVDFLSVVALSTSMLIMATAYSKIADIKHLSYTNVLIISSIMPLMAVGLALSGYILSGMPTFSIMQGLSILLVSATIGLASYLLLKAVSTIKFESLKYIPLLPIILPMIAWGIVKSSEILKDVQNISFAQVLSVGLIGIAMGIATFALSIVLKQLKSVSYKEMLALPFMIPLIAGGIVLASRIFNDFIPLSDPLGLIIGSAVIGLSILFFVPAIHFLGKMKLEDVLTGSLMILPLSYAIVLSSRIFNDFIPLSDPLNVAISTLSMGVSILLFTPTVMLLGKLKINDLMIGILGSVLTSAAIVAVSNIFSFLPTEMKSPDLMWSLSAGIAVGGFALIAAGVGLFAGTNPFFWIGLAAVLAVSASIVAVSHILPLGNYSKYPPLDWALGVGGSLLAFSGAMILASAGGVASAIGSLFTDGEDPLIKVAKSMVAVSLLLQGGIWDKGYPKLPWALGVGTAITMFAAAYIAITGLEGAGRLFSKLTGGESQSFNDFISSVATSMLTANQILGTGNWNTDKAPSYEWAKGVGTAIAMFAAAYVAITATSGINKVFSFLSGNKSQSFNDFVISVSNSLITANSILSGVVWSTRYPSKEFSDGVGSFLISMATAFSKINTPSFFSMIGSLFGVKDNKNTLQSFVESASNSIVSASNILSGGNFTKIPDAKYLHNFSEFLLSMSENIDDFDVDSENVSIFTSNLNMLAPALSNISNSTQNPISDVYIQNFDKLVKILDKMPDKSRQIFRLADSFVSLSSSLKDIKTFDNLSKVSASVVLLSAVDDAKLQVVLDKLKANEDTIKTIYGGNIATNLLDSATKALDRIINSDNDKKEKEKEKEVINVTTNIDPKFYDEISEVRKLLKSIKTTLDKPSSAKSFHK